MLSRTLQAIAAVALVTACGGDSSSVAGPGSTPAPVRAVPWDAGAWTQPVPAWGSTVRLTLPVALDDIIFGPAGGLGAFGAHEGGHVEGLNHIWIPTRPGVAVRSWGDGTVTRIEDMGDRGNGTHEYFITVDYGRGLVGKHMDVDAPLVSLGARVKAGDVVARAPSAEFMLIDMNRTDGERTGGTTGSPVSPFDYLRDDVKAALVARHVNEVVGPYFSKGAVAGNQRPWEPYLTNKMLYHADARGTPAGEWILINKGWSVPDPSYFDVMALFDVSNGFGHFQRAEFMDHDLAMANNKHMMNGELRFEGEPGTFVVDVIGGQRWYARYKVDESSGRAKLMMEWSRLGYPSSISPNAAMYTERSAIYLKRDAIALGIEKQ